MLVILGNMYASCLCMPVIIENLYASCPCMLVIPGNLYASCPCMLVVYHENGVTKDDYKVYTNKVHQILEQETKENFQQLLEVKMNKMESTIL